MSARPKRLLLVDDDPGVVDFLCESLTTKGYEAVGVTSPAEALARVKREDFDMVITDVQMPEMRGTDLLAEVLQEKPNQLVLLITAFGSIELAVACVKAGACDFIAKPFKIEALVFGIERAFRERQMRREIVRLRSSRAIGDSGDLIARSESMRAVIELARRAARSRSTVLLTGETGTGKSALARFIHQNGESRADPFVHLNCAALHPNLVESELFGVRRGAFTDARESRSGVFVEAGSGTLFLDELGELTLETQAKLLHCLESGTVRPVGGSAEVAVKARVIAATNKPLEELLRDGTFRPDLYYRLNVIRIEVPPLRARREDVVPLVDLLLGRAGKKQSRMMIGVSAAAMKQLIAYPWPGNVRELANLIERAVAMTDHDTLVPEDLDFPESRAPSLALDGSVRLDELERAHVRRVVAAHGGNKAAAARLLGINRRTLYRKLDD